MDKVFLEILNMSFTASVVIVAVILVRLLLQKAPKLMAYALWAVVLFRLLCPFSLESALALLPTSDPIPQDIIYQTTPQIDTGFTMVDNVVNPVLPPVTNHATSINPIQIWLAVGQYAWYAGMMVMAVYSVVSYGKLRKKLIGAVQLRDNIYLVDYLDTPFVTGLFAPKIYLPSNLDEAEQDYIVAHEQCHIRRFDHVTRLLGFVALTLHWFNPLVWVAFVLSGKDMELSCDEAVMKTLEKDQRTHYAQSLLRLATGRKLLTATPLAFGEGETKGRVKNVLRYKKPALWAVGLGVVAVVIALVMLGSNPEVEETPSEPEVETPSDTFETEIVPEEVDDPWDGIPTYDVKYEEVVDAVAYALYEDMLCAEMETALMSVGDMGDFTGYEVTRFVPAWDYENSADNSTVQVYDFDFALLTDDPHSITWAGGMYMDDQGRVQNTGGTCGLAVKYVGEQLVAARFLPSDLQWVYTSEDDRDIAMETVNNSLVGSWFVEEETIIPMVIEGFREEIPATLTYKSDYTIAIPTEDFVEVWDGHWQSTINEDVYFDILCLDDTWYIQDVAKVYLGTEGEIIDWMNLRSIFVSDAGNTHFLMELRAGEKGTYYGLAHFPDEAMEGFGTRIDYIFDTVTLRNAPTATALTPAQIQEANDAFATFLPDGSINPIGHFFGSYYAQPQDMNLGQFVYYMERETMITPEDTEEIQDLEDHGFSLPMSANGTFPVPIGQIPYTSVEQLLNQYMNVSLSDMLLYGDAIYSDDYQCFYSYASDFGIGVFSCTSGDISGDTVHLYNQHTTLTLEQVDGQWYIVSYLQSEG